MAAMARQLNSDKVGSVLILEFEAEPNSEGLNKGIDISLTKTKTNQDNNRVSSRINDE